MQRSTRIFVGNLSRETSAPTLGKLFETIGTVRNAKIATRDGKSRGFGYVEMADVALAERACASLSKRIVDGREISVEFARQAGDVPPRPARGPPRGQAPRQPQVQEGPRRPAGGARAGFPLQGYDPYQLLQQYGAFSPYAFLPPYFLDPYRRLGRDRRGAQGGRSGREPAAQPSQRRDAQAAPQRDRAPRRQPGGTGRPPRQRRPFDTSAELSKTRLHVSNLPYDLTKEDLQDVFKEYEVTQVTVPHRRFTTTRNMGFGYVDVANEEEQKKILEKMPSVDIKGRTCKVHPALAKPPPPTAPAEPVQPEPQ